MHPSTDDLRLEALATTMSERIATITRTLATWVQQAPMASKTSKSTSSAS